MSVIGCEPFHPSNGLLKSRNNVNSPMSVVEGCAPFRNACAGALGWRAANLTSSCTVLVYTVSKYTSVLVY